MTKSSPTKTFHLFGRLPLELRNRIWFYCLPRRVVPLDNILWLVDRHSTYRNEQQCWVDSRHVNCRAEAPPFIASVCREARRVAFRWGGVEEMPTGVSLTHVWIQRKLDSLLFAWTYNDSVAAGHGQDMMERFLYRQRWDPCARVCLTAEQFFQFYPSPSAPESEYMPCIEIDDSESIAILLHNAWTEDEVDAKEPDLSDPMDVDVAMETVYIHATRADVLASQLFGRMADEPSQLVDYDDAVTLAKFRALFNKNPNNQNRVALTEKFNAIESPEFPAQVAKWLAKVAWKLLAIKWLHEKQHNPQSSIYWDSMQIFDRPVLEGDLLWMENDTRVNSFTAGHPWVIEETRRLPRLSPKIWFTYCTKNCEVKTDLTKH